MLRFFQFFMIPKIEFSTMRKKTNLWKFDFASIKYLCEFQLECFRINFVDCFRAHGVGVWRVGRFLTYWNLITEKSFNLHLIENIFK